MNNERKNNRETIPFQTNRIPDPELTEGEEMVLIPGQEGVRIWGNDGNVIKEIEPTLQVVSYGPKSVVVPAGKIRTVNNQLEEGVENVITEGLSGIRLIAEDGEVVREYESFPFEIEYGPVREEIPFDVVRKANNDLREGEENILVLGQSGLQLVDEEGNATLIDEPRTEEVDYGPKRISIPFNGKRQANPDLSEGEEQVIDAGASGLELEDEEGNRTLISEPGIEFVEYGPARVQTPFDTIRKSNPDLAAKEERVVGEGVMGLQLEDEEGTVTPVSEPVTEEIEYGPLRHYLPFETERVSNPDLAEDEENITTAGQEGLQFEDEEGNITLGSEPITKVIEYGPTRVSLPYDTVRRSNPEIAEGQEKVIFSGEEGLQLEDEEGTVTSVSEPVTEEIEYGPVRRYLPFETERTANPDLAEGEERTAVSGAEEVQFEDEEGQITPGSEAITEIIEYGPIRHYFPFETERVVNSDLAEGEERVVTAGKEGIQLEDEAGNITDFASPVTQIVEYGPVRISLPYTTVRSVDTELKQGEERIKAQGQEGLRLEDENGGMIAATPPIAEEVQYGPEFKVVPYKTIYYPYLELEEGDLIPLSQGINGLEVVDEDGKLVESHPPFASEVAYGPDEPERQELEDEQPQTAD